MSVLGGAVSPADPAAAAVKTWRYLRLAMILLVVGLAAAIRYEWSRTADGCFQGSISAYYYTPVRGLLIGALVTIGVCLVSLRGDTDPEDVLLNLAGFCAPFVALIPTPGRGHCRSAPTSGGGRNVNIANNVTAMFTIAVLGLLVLAALEVARRVRKTGTAPSTTDLVGYGVAVVLLGVAIWIFNAKPEWFRSQGHNVASVSMFFFIWLNVIWNAIQLRITTKQTAHPARILNRYSWIAIGMFVAAVVHLVAALTTDWRHVVLSIEAVLIGFFAYFWLLQTVELWDKGLRSGPPVSPPPSSVETPQPIAA
jgi:hypothetical protein